MTQFTYKARFPNGSVSVGVIEAPDQRTANDKLRAQKLILMELRESAATPLAVLLSKINPFKPKVSSKELVLFSRQLSTLVSAGVPIV